ncbi:MAG: hypothetical protein CMQ21_09800 [Gammaproteobacteria bacterium]|nr:hypothetical protein [Gammaproteobacteria bacterium]|tara:strand:- start:617 stop:850 length:234 start_codon:yes stop_codon:yes gene_type:complete
MLAALVRLLHPVYTLRSGIWDISEPPIHGRAIVARGEKKACGKSQEKLKKILQKRRKRRKSLFRSLIKRFPATEGET